MKNFTCKIISILLLFSLFTNENAQAQTLTRGPYLQVGKQDSITIRWRTSTATNSKVTWGPAYIVGPGVYPSSFTMDVATPVTEHIVRIGGLSADTKYWYTIGSTTLVLQQTSTNYFLTLPPSNTTRKLRFLAIGDCGNNSTNQVNVKNAFTSYIGSNDIDAMILLGDNAYSSGTDTEFQTNFFNVYKDDLLKYNKLYPAPGNHDYGNSTANNTKTGSTPANSMPYHLNFSVPMAGEVGGVASGVKNYYSFNVGDVHFISLDSYGSDGGLLRDTAGLQTTWLKADLAANTKKWTVAYFHHPPYTKTSHTSDSETDLVAVREKFIRILERNGVDLVLSGHSHGYERSYLLKGFYNTYASPLLDASFNASSHTATGNTQNAKYDASGALSCPYTYNSGSYNHGSIYIVSGSAGQLGGTTAGYPQDCMYYSDVSNGGCLYFEVDSNRMDVKFVSYTTGPIAPFVRDQFTILKDVKKKQTINVVTNAPLTLTASWRGNYYWPTNAGATTQSVNLSNSVNGTYTYYAWDANSGNCLADTFVVTVSGTLPIALSSYNVNLNKDKVLIDWSTAQEQNNRFFTVEKSGDGINYHALGKVAGAGNSSVKHSYQMTDYAPLEGVNYYRLHQTDYDGTIKYYEVKKINYLTGKPFTASIRNNGSGQVSITINTAKAMLINMSVVDMQGKNILQESFTINAGGGTRNLDLKSGAYIIVLSNETGERVSNKIIVP